MLRFRLSPLFVGALLLLVGCCTGDVRKFEAQDVEGPPEVQLDVVEQHAEQFETDVPERPAGSEEEQIAAAYILGTLQQNGYFARLDSVPVADLFRSTNVIAEPEGGAEDPGCDRRRALRDGAGLARQQRGARAVPRVEPSAQRRRAGSQGAVRRPWGPSTRIEKAVPSARGVWPGSCSTRSRSRWSMQLRGISESSPGVLRGMRATAPRKRTRSERHHGSWAVGTQHRPGFPRHAIRMFSTRRASSACPWLAGRRLSAPCYCSSCRDSEIRVLHVLPVRAARLHPRPCERGAVPGLRRGPRAACGRRRASEGVPGRA